MIQLLKVSLILALISIALGVYPLSTSSRWIVDQNGHRVKFACVNWYGFDQKDYIVGGLQANTIDNIASLIKGEGFNCVRLPWSNEMFERNPVITNTTIIAANMGLRGLRALDIMDRVIDSLDKHGLMVILDNHMSDADWCCSGSDGNGLWYNERYSATNWVNDWKGIVSRYLNQPAVVGVDLRNELRTSCGFPNGQCRNPVWGGSNTETDWHLAATNCGNAIHTVNPNLLIIVEGLSYASDLTGIYNLPIQLSKPNKVVYEAHDYSWFHGNLQSYDQLHTALGNAWGYIITQGKSFTAPVWVGEFGTCHTSDSCVNGQPNDQNGGFWFSCFRKYLQEADFDWSYWAIDGTESSGTGRVFGREESFGILNLAWNAPASRTLLSSLQQVQNKTQGP